MLKLKVRVQRQCRESSESTESLCASCVERDKGDNLYTGHIIYSS